MHSRLRLEVFNLNYRPTNELVGYVTLLNDSIKIKGTTMHEAFLKKGIGYHWMPALKIGRLAVDLKYQGIGVGSQIILFAIKIVERLNKYGTGCRFITVDAKRNESAEKLYKKMNFIITKESKGNAPTPMFFDAIKFLKKEST
ncbi:MAG: GNAT family N-acetyltransferase [archaeon]